MEDFGSLVRILGCKVGSLPSFYLSLLLGAKINSRAVWNPVVERIDRKLDSWKAPILSPILSKNGCLALSNSV